MSTRGALYITKGNEVLAATYNHYDSYPDGVGKDIVALLSNESINKIRENINKVVMHTADEILKKCYEAAGSKSEYEQMDMGARNSIYNGVRIGMGIELYDAISLLSGIINGEVTDMRGDPYFAADSLFCEYAYVIDLELNTFEVYVGFNNYPLEDSDRFKYLEDKCDNDRAKKYYPCRLAAKFELEKLPTEEELISAVSDGEKRLEEEDAERKDSRFPMVFQLYRDKEKIKDIKALNMDEVKKLINDTAKDAIEYNGKTTLYYDYIEVLNINMAIFEKEPL